MRREYRVLCKEANLTVTAGRSKFPPWGVAGGMKGTPNYAVIHRSGREPMETRKIAAFRMETGDLVSLRTGGGGGWGDPMERDVKKVQWDVLNGYITPEQASSIYGTMIDPETLEVDSHQTRLTRERKKK